MLTRNQVGGAHLGEELPPLKPMIVSSERTVRYFKCSHCPEVYYHNYRLRNHVGRAHPGENLPPLLKPRKAVSMNNNVQAIPTCTIPCPYCSEICVGHDGLGEHVSRVHPNQQLSLPLLNPSLQRPVIVGSEKTLRHFKCTYCVKVYYRNDRLRNHVGRAHPGEVLPPLLRPRKALSVNSNVQATPTCTVPCPYCSEICVGHDGLREHVSRVHPNQQLSLPLLKPSLQRPVIVSSEKRVRYFKCFHCPEVYYHNYRLRNHVGRAHPGENLPPLLKPRKAVSMNNNVQAIPTCTIPCPYCSEICVGHDGLGEHVGKLHLDKKLSLPLLKPSLQKPVIGCCQELPPPHRKCPKNRLHADMTLKKKTNWLTQKFKSLKDTDALNADIGCVTEEVTAGDVPDTHDISTESADRYDKEIKEFLVDIQKLSTSMASKKATHDSFKQLRSLLIVMSAPTSSPPCLQRGSLPINKLWDSVRSEQSDQQQTEGKEACSLQSRHWLKKPFCCSQLQGNIPTTIILGNQVAQEFK